MYVPGARWDSQTGMIADAKLKDLTPQMPVIFIKVNQNIEITFVRLSNVCKQERYYGSPIGRSSV